MTSTAIFALLAVTVMVRVHAVTNITYERFQVDSVIVSRYARTSVTSVLFNPDEDSKEESFQIQLPYTAFISNFTM